MSRAVLLALCPFAVALAQPAFTAASVKPGDSSPGARPMILQDPGRIQYANVTLKTLLTRAFGVKDYQVKGPDWLSTARYSLVATMPPGSSDAEVGRMLETLLVDRFRLRLRRTSEELPVYVLVVGKNGPKLSRAEGGELSVRSAAGALRGRNMSMWNLANLLGGLLDRPVLDQTGVEGQYDLALEFSPAAGLGPGMAKLSMEAAMSGAPDSAQGQSIFTAIQQLGLKLEPRKSPVEMIVVESALRTPVEN